MVIEMIKQPAKYRCLLSIIKSALRILLLIIPAMVKRFSGIRRVSVAPIITVKEGCISAKGSPLILTALMMKVTYWGE